MADIEFSRLLQDARRESGMRQRDVCVALEVGQSTLSAWETGKAEPSVSVFLRLCQMYGITDISGYFHTLTGEGAAAADKFTPAEGRLLSQIRRLDLRGRAELQNHIDFSLKWQEEREEKEEKVVSLKFGLRKLPYFAQPAAAGLGNYLDDVDCETIEIDAPPEADAVIRISGDSMEPVIHDGDKIFIQYMPEIAEGEIGIFVLNGSAYCKRLCYENGTPLLVSLNPAYSPIKICEGDRVITHGRVLLT